MWVYVVLELFLIVSPEVRVRVGVHRCMLVLSLMEVGMILGGEGRVRGGNRKCVLLGKLCG